MYPNGHDRQRPHVYIPPGAQRPINPSRTARSYSPYAFQVTPPPYGNDDPGPLLNPWDTVESGPSYSPETPRARTQSMAPLPSRSSSASILNPTPAPMGFPEPQISRATSAKASLSPAPPSLTHRHSRSALVSSSGMALHHNQSSLSLAESVAASYYADDGNDQWADSASIESHDETDDVSKELSAMALASEEGIQRFQQGKLLEKDEEWHRMVPEEAREALGKQEVQRQSVIFEVLKSEREYVFDLRAIQDVYIEPLRNANPPIIPPPHIQGFITEVFGNLYQILNHHQKMLASLFERQRDQHPLIQSIADIVLDTTLKADFRSAYETYIKHYPLAESHHRTELRRNPAYQAFVQAASSDSRIRKRDLITFLSRPVTRLPRLNLLLEQTLKLTDKEHDHPDVETLPIILGILNDCIKSTQPGIEAAESKVKLWGVCESLVFQKGEIMDLDLYDKHRTLVYSGPVVRRKGGESTWSSWTDYFGALLDHYFLLTREEKRPNGAIKRYLISRPLPLSYIRLGSFDSPPETRRERGEEGVLSRIRYQNTTVYPFTIYHSSNINRRYTLYVTSEAARQKWHTALLDALAVHKARQEGNMYFDPQKLTDRFFRMPSPKTAYNSGVQLRGRVCCAVPFTSGGRRFIAVGCQSGIYVAPRGDERFQKILNFSNPTSIAAVQSAGQKTFNKFIVHADSSLISYSLDLMARVALGQADAKALSASMERIAGHDTNVVFFRQAFIAGRMLVIYASKKLLQSSLTLHVMEVIDVSEAALAPKRNSLKHPSFRPYGEPGFVPKDAHDVTALVKTIGICSSEGIVILDPTNVARSATTFVPDMSVSSEPMALLKIKLEEARPMGLVRCSQDELLVVYDTVGTYITRHGTPSRSCGFIKWETKANSYTHRGAYILLFSSRSIEIHHVGTGRLAQVIEATDIRLLTPGPIIDDKEPVLVAMRGELDDKDGMSDKIVELVETSEISMVHHTMATFSDPTKMPMPAPSAPGAPRPAALWDEWDMS